MFEITHHFKLMCDRNFGIGADGVLLVANHPDYDTSMRIFNSDGEEAEMCGNGLRCVAAFIDKKLNHRNDTYKIKTMNGSYEVLKRNDTFAIEMSEVRDMNAFDLSEFQDYERSFFVNTGVPHLVFLVKNIKEMSIKEVGAKYRFHKKFPNGTNVNFVEVLEGNQNAYVRTYERGVEDETFSCGTGVTASGLALNSWLGWNGKLALQTKGGSHELNIGEKILFSGKIKHCFSGDYEL